MIVIKKGNFALVGIFITAVLAVVLLANLLIPTVKSTYYAYPYQESYSRTNNSLNQTATLTQTNVASVTSVGNSTLTLTSGSNYTVTSNTVKFLDNKAPVSTYTIAYTAYSTSTNLTSTETVLMALVILAGVIGLAYWLFVAFGLA